MEEKGLTKTQTLILLMILIAIGGIVLYSNKNINNFSPLDYVLKR